MRSMKFMGLTILLAACTVKRDTQWPQGEEELIFEKAQLSLEKLSVKTSSDGSALSTTGKELRAAEQVPKAVVTEVTGDDRLKSLFKDLSLAGGGEQSFRLGIDKRYVTAFKVVSGVEARAALSTLEQELAQKKGAELWIPVFQVEIEAQGIVERQKNDLNEDTHVLRLKETDPDQATHIKISTVVSKRQMVSIPAEQGLEEGIFLRSRLDGSVLSQAQLEAQLGVRVAQAGSYLTKINGEKLSLLLITQAQLLPDNLKELLKAQDQGGPSRGDIARCSDEIKAQVPEEARAECVMVLRFEVALHGVSAHQRPLDSDGTLGPDIVFQDDPVGQAGELVRIVRFTEPSEINWGSDFQTLNPRRLLTVKEMGTGEFLFRRTLQDSPNGFNFTFPGSSGRLELVKFKFEENRVQVVRADALIRSDGGTDVDAETLLSLPASYVKLVNRDAQGNLLQTPRVVTATPDEPQALALVDWTANSIPTVSSPLEYYGLEQCFDGARERTVSDVDNHLGDSGTLSFTLESTYAASRGVDCAGLEKEDFFDVVQKNFSFKERLSFKRYNRPANEDALMAVPYEAQKKLGFGFFTYSKKVPNGAGRTDIDGTEVPLPALFDLHDGRTITYVLGGLPTGTDAKTQALRQTIISSTRKVIADLNDGFRKALKDSPLESRRDVIELKIEGVDTDTRALGDLDRNHIYYVQKLTDSGVIGLGGAHANPRSGKVEAASVFLYGGNMLSMIDDMKRVAKARREYHAIMDEAASAAEMKAVVQGTKTATLSGAVALPHLPSVASLASAQDLGRLPSTKVTPVLTALAQKLGHLSPAHYDAEALMAARALPAAGKAFHQAFLSAVTEKDLTGSEERLSELFRGQAKMSSARRVIERMRQNGLCVFAVGDAELAAAGAVPGLEEKPVLEVLGEVWASTLAHEIGHNLGLRHNFEGSFDGSNFHFEGKDPSTRNYSSVMDYISDEFIHYDGLGPQDVAALRAAYAGLVEMDPKKVQSLPTQAGKKILSTVSGPKELVAGRYLKLSDVLSAAGVKSWLDLDTSRVRQVGLKAYRFCSDEEAGESPTCNRFDLGQTPTEIVDNAIANYRELYSLRNFPGDRLRFSVLDEGPYVARTFARFVPIRQFLEETFYQLLNGADQETIQAYVPAVIKGLLFFHEIVRTPDASTLADGDERFAREKLTVPSDTDPSQGVEKEVTVETKALRNLHVDSTTDRLKVRGMEIDKAVALILLTARDLGFRRYEEISLRLAYPDFERLVVDAKTPLDLPTVGLLHEILQSHIQAAAVHPKYGMLSLPANYKAEASDLMRFEALVGAILNLDVDGIEAADNNSALFRVLSAFKAPAKMPFVMAPGAQNDLQYWAYPEAVASRALVDRGVMLAQLRGLNKNGLATDMASYFLKRLQQGKATPAPTTQPVKEPADELKQLEAAIDARLAQLPESAGPRRMAELFSYQQTELQLALQIAQAQQDPSVDPHPLALEIESLQTALANLASAQPTVGAALASLNLAEQVPTIDLIRPARALDVEEGVMFRNLQTVSSLFYMAHPEYNR